MVWFPLKSIFLPSKMSSEKIDEKHDLASSSGSNHDSEVDIYSLHELHAGRLIVDPAYVCVTRFTGSQWLTTQQRG